VAFVPIGGRKQSGIFQRIVAGSPSHCRRMLLADM
jgi:hypothetical protein